MADESTSQRASAHGTYARHQKHIADGEKPCLPCTDAAASYRRAWNIRAGKVSMVRISLSLAGSLLATMSDEARERVLAELGEYTTAALLEAAEDTVVVEHTHNPCCSSHGVPMSCAQYRRTQFVEVRPCCSADAARIAADEAVPRG